MDSMIRGKNSEGKSRFVLVDDDGRLVMGYRNLEADGRPNEVEGNNTGPYVVVGNTTPLDVNIESIENNYQDVIFHNAADANATGETIDVDGYTELLISITGTDVKTSTITFKAVDADTNATNIGLAVRLSDGVIASSTSTVAATPGEKWIIPVRGVTQVQMPLTNLTGSGATVTVKGRLT